MRVRLQLWVRYDSVSGYVWPQVYGDFLDAYIDEELNYPVKVMRLVSEPYVYDVGKRLSGPSFGSEILSRRRRGKRNRESGRLPESSPARDN